MIEELLMNIAKEAGKFVMVYFGQDDVSRILKVKSPTNYSIVMDEMVEELIVNRLKGKFDGSILAEERGKLKLGDSDYTIYIDPLDGSFNYSRGIPHFCISMGLQKGGEMVFGVVYDPNTDELFHASRGKGAFLNGKRIQTRKSTEGILIINLEKGKSYKGLSGFADKIKEAGKLRTALSMALDLCYTACGRTDATVTSHTHAWDIAAGALIVEEAGGLVTDIDGKEWKPRDTSLVAASTKEVYEKIMGAIGD